MLKVAHFLLCKLVWFLNCLCISIAEAKSLETRCTSPFRRFLIIQRRRKRESLLKLLNFRLIWRTMTLKRTSVSRALSSNCLPGVTEKHHIQPNFFIALWIKIVLIKYRLQMWLLDDLPGSWGNTSTDLNPGS